MSDSGGEENDEPTPAELLASGEDIAAELPRGSDVRALLLVLLATNMSLGARRGASLGRCSTDGTSLRFEGRPDGLRICCGGNTVHCWKVGEAIP